MASHRDGSVRAVGIRDVAKMAGVSVASASFALNGQPGVADDTRRRILAAAQHLGYRANPQAQALRRGRTTTYGFVVRNFANPFFLDVLRLRHFRRLCRVLGLRGSVLYSPLTIPDVHVASAVLLAAPDAPTAIITNSDYTAHGVYKAARELRLQVGPEVSVLGHDDLPTSELLDPPLATIRLDRQEMGRALMRRLLGEVPLDDYIAPVELVARASVQPPVIRPRAGGADGADGATGAGGAARVGRPPAASRA